MGMIDRMRQALGRTARAAPAVITDTHPNDLANDLAFPDELPRQIHAVRDASLEIYRQHGLPTASGNYRARGPEAPWERLPDDLSPSQKWALVQDAPEGAGWRFTDRGGLGRHSPVEDVRQAARLLQKCDNLQRKLESNEGITASDIADAMLVGTASGFLLQTRSAKAADADQSSLVFTSVSEEACPDSD